MKIAYYLNEGRKKNLYCRISDGTERVSFSLGYTIDPKTWNANQEQGDYNDPYFYTLWSFKSYLGKRYHELKGLEVPSPNVLATLKSEAESFIDGTGIEGIARKMFDDDNKEDGIPTYDQFLQAFEKYSGLERSAYKAQTIDNIIHFHTAEGSVLEIDTYAGLIARLKSFVERRSYDEIYSETNNAIWSEIYLDAGIEKHVFMPKLLREWKNFWDEKYTSIKERVGKTDHLDKTKEHSWRQLQVFMECYDDAGDIIELSMDIDESDLYPMVVVTMLQVFNAEVCYDEYCESEFSSGDDWESISLVDDEEESDDEEETDVVQESPIFFIRESEF